MIGKNNLKKQYERQAEKVETYSIKKFKAGAASVLIKGFSQLRRQSLRNKKPPAMRVRDKS